MTKQQEQVTSDSCGDQTAVELELEVYPLRPPGEDPRWALRVVWTWVVIAVLLLVFFVVLFTLGYWID